MPLNASEKEMTVSSSACAVMHAMRGYKWMHIEVDAFHKDKIQRLLPQTLITICNNIKDKRTFTVIVL